MSYSICYKCCLGKVIKLFQKNMFIFKILDQQRSQEFRVVRQLVVAAGAGDGGVRWGSTGQVPGHAHVYHQRPPEDRHEVCPPPAGHGPQL